MYLGSKEEGIELGLEFPKERLTATAQGSHRGKPWSLRLCTSPCGSAKDLVDQAATLQGLNIFRPGATELAVLTKFLHCIPVVCDQPGHNSAVSQSGVRQGHRIGPTFRISYQ